jgi:hypothetical protein
MSVGNPLIAQGTLNRLRASVIWPANASLNVVASYLGRGGISLALEGDSTQFIGTMAGVVTSPEPYQMIGLTINLLKSQQLGSLYKTAMETNALIGDGTVRADVTTLPPYQIYNCAIQSVQELRFSGDDAGFVVRIRGYYLLNSTMWNT